ncbi:MAG TPA: GIY-YIG nuclease family protein [Streptosporangiaceae bacterium]|nr:GIY-YIG nuclease family protein [Streptosporangiaceae bacterium]
MRNWFIYILKYDDGEPLYVGATGDLRRRLKEYRKDGYTPPHEVLEVGCGTKADRDAAEHRWIAKYRDMGAYLVNRTEGGDGVETVSSVTRAKLSAANKGRRMPPGFGAKLSALSKGRPRNWSQPKINAAKAAKRAAKAA